MKKIIVTIIAVVAATLAYANWPIPALPSGSDPDRIVINKSAREMTLYQKGARVRTYRVSLGSEPAGDKQREGDGRTPEGRYVIDRHKPDSSFHQALHISYPTDADRAHAAHLGVSPGGDIMIHGLPNHLGWLGRLQRLRDWTAGCVAVTNPEVEQIYRAVPDGTPVEIRP